ncbi:MAG TPA: hypothetical protein VF933_11895 [Streptosporangiaceae bacterium]
MEAALTAAGAAVMVVFAARHVLVIGRACHHVAVAFAHKIVLGTRIMARFDDVELQLLIARSQTPGRSEKERDR